MMVDILWNHQDSHIVLFPTCNSAKLDGDEISNLMPLLDHHYEIKF